MKLCQKDAELFFELMWGLQFFVNQRQKVLPHVQSVEEFLGLPIEEKAQVRDILWENPGLIDAYVQEDPDKRSAEQLDIVQKWSRFVQGSFQIFRLLKKHAIFIGQEKVYGVLALHNACDAMYPGRPLPIMVEAVLLPFKGQIIYDGLLQGYNVFFGGGIRGSLKDQYMTAKQNGRIITTLEPETAPAPARKSRTGGKDWIKKVDAVIDATKPLKGGPAIQSAAFALLRASAGMAQLAVYTPDELEELWKQERQVRRALARLCCCLAWLKMPISSERLCCCLAKTPSG